MKICRCCGAQYEASQDPNVCEGCTNLEIPARAPDDDRRPDQENRPIAYKPITLFTMKYLLLLLLVGCQTRPNPTNNIRCSEVLMPRPNGWQLPWNRHLNSGPNYNANIDFPPLWTQTNR